MSAQKVRRYYFDLSVCGDVKRFEAPDAGYVEYVDVAGLVEALKALLPWAESASYGGPDIEADINNARKELARWQS